MNQERVVKAGLLGFGTVGSGVYKLVERQKDEMALKAGAGLEIQKILVHNMNKKREGVDQSLLTDKWEDIMNDDEIEIVIEICFKFTILIKSHSHKIPTFIFL